MQSVIPPVDVALRICADAREGFQQAADRIARAVLPGMQRATAATKPSKKASAAKGEQS